MSLCASISRVGAMIAPYIAQVVGMCMMYCNMLYFHAKNQNTNIFLCDFTLTKILFYMTAVLEYLLLQA